MATIRLPKDEDEVKKIGLADLRKEYLALGNDVNRILNNKIYYCHSCNEFHTAEAFYADKRYKSGVYPECKKTLLLQATDYDKKTETYTDNREKTMYVFKKLDLPFKDSLYRSAMETTQASMGEKNRQTGYQHMLVMIKSLPHYKGQTWANSEFDEDDEVIENQDTRVARKEIKKIFGSGFTEADYVYLQDQYDDWKARTAVDSKSQEIYVTQICLQQLDIYKDRKLNKDVSNKLKALDTLMNSANLQPKQNVTNAATDALTFGQMIQKWEEHDPVPEPAPEFKDVDGIGKYIRVWFAGWIGKILGLNSVYTEECEDYIKQYSVQSSEAVEEEESSSGVIYEKLFGKEAE